MPIPSDHKEVGTVPNFNPKTDSLAHDNEQIGWKLLEDMGWAKGLGLGRENQGIVDFLKVKQKLDTKGIGYKRKPEEWFKHQEALEEVLSYLSKMNQSTADENEPEENSESERKVSSLQDISKKSKSRVHYKKFTQGKDLSLYSKKDLACIIGSKKKTEDLDNSQEVSRDDSLDYPQDKYSYGGSMRDYFNKKMEALKKKRDEGLLGDKPGTLEQEEKLESSPAIPLPDLEFEPAKTNFSFNISVQQPEPQETEMERSLKSERKKKKKKEKQEEYEAKDENLDKKLKKKSKGKKNKERVSDGEEILPDGKTDSEFQAISKKKRPDQILCKKLKHLYDKDVLKEIVGGSNVVGKQTKKLKKIFSKAEGDQDTFDTDVHKENESEDIKENNKLKREKLKEEIQVFVNDIERENVSESKEKRKKSKKSKDADKEIKPIHIIDEEKKNEVNVKIESKKDCVGEEIQVNDHIDGEALIETETKGKRKKSKKRKEDAVECQISDHASEEENLNVEAEEKKKKIKKSRKSEEIGQFYGMNDEMMVKKKSKKSNDGPNEEIQQISDHAIGEIVNDVEFEQEKVNKKTKNSGEEITQFNENVIDCEKIGDEVKVKKKKSKKSKSSTEEIQISGYVIEEEIPKDVEMEKSKKKDKNIGEEIPQFYDEVKCEKMNDELKVKKKKSKKSNDGPNEEIQISDHVMECENVNDNNREKKKSKKRNKDENGETPPISDDVGAGENMNDGRKATKRKSMKDAASEEILLLSDEDVECEILNDVKMKNETNSNKKNKNAKSHQLLTSTKDEVKLNAMNESYISATCDGKNKQKRKKDKFSENDEGFQRPFKKMRKFAREISSAADLFRGNSSKDEGQKNEALQGETISHSDENQLGLKDIEGGASTVSGKKLVGQRSLKELTTELGNKLFNKRESSQKTLSNISSKHNPPVEKKKNNVKVSIKGETRTINVNELFPGSNLSSIKGYGKK